MAEEGGIVRGESGDDHHDLVSQVEVASLSDDNTHCLVCFSGFSLWDQSGNRLFTETPFLV